ncbi:Bug family tripartite tricarboxylate transporter substrate binding protein [Terrihabitans sp. B22-R8]|uniref:Bug family tripartite tricarboxylate transporter substrate binding protein n=1 Tax=Terrihabitans sp. B22-R8 TaxID=3425128 RepID=UPI00403CB1BF
MIRGALRAALAAAMITLPVFAGTASAQDFSRTVRLVVPYAPGGTSDILARLIAPKLSEAIGQAVVVENKPGAAGNIGADAVAKARPDGHTLLLADVGTLSTAPTLFPDLGFDVKTDLAPVGMVMFGPYVLAVNPSLPVKSVQELIDYSKANPGKVAIANSGIGGMNHITAVQIAKGLGLDWKMVPYKGGSAASRAVVSGESQIIINGAPATLPFVTNKQLVGLALTGDERNSVVPDLPTFKESNLPAPNSGTFQGIVTTGKTPPEMVERLNAELQKILAMPDIQAKIAEQGGTARPGTAAEFKTWLDESIEAYGKVIREAGIKVEG